MMYGVNTLVLRLEILTNGIKSLERADFIRFRRVERGNYIEEISVEFS